GERPRAPAAAVHARLRDRARRRERDGRRADLPGAARHPPRPRSRERRAARERGSRPHRRRAGALARSAARGERENMSEAQWYMAIGGQQVGPVTEQDVVTATKSGSAAATTLVFTDGMDNWTALRQVDRFKSHLPASAPPPMPAAAGRPAAPRAAALDHRIRGEEPQLAE